MEYSNGAPVVSNKDVLLAAGVHLNRCQFEVLGASVALFALETQGLVKALGNIDVVELPSVSELLPDEDRKIG